MDETDKSRHRERIIKDSKHESDKSSSSSDSQDIKYKRQRKKDIKKKDKDFITVKIPRSSLFLEETSDDSSDYEDSPIYIPKEAIFLRKSRLKKVSVFLLIW